MKPIPTMRAAGFLTSSYRSAWLRRRSAAWLGATLILFSALFPLVAQAGNRFLGLVTWVELCSGYSMEVIAIDRDGNPVDPDAELGARCPICTVCAASSVLPPPTDFSPAPELISSMLLSWGYVQPDTAEHVHYQAQPRAPPSVTG